MPEHSDRCEKLDPLARARRSLRRPAASEGSPVTCERGLFMLVKRSAATPSAGRRAALSPLVFRAQRSGQDRRRGVRLTHKTRRAWWRVSACRVGASIECLRSPPLPSLERTRTHSLPRPPGVLGRLPSRGAAAEEEKRVAQSNPAQVENASNERTASIFKLGCLVLLALAHPSIRNKQLRGFSPRAHYTD
jgi:hypothetical protein